MGCGCANDRQTITPTQIFLDTKLIVINNITYYPQTRYESKLMPKVSKRFAKIMSGYIKESSAIKLQKNPYAIPLLEERKESLVDLIPIQKPTQERVAQPGSLLPPSNTLMSKPEKTSLNSYLKNTDFTRDIDTAKKENENSIFVKSKTSKDIMKSNDSMMINSVS